MYIWLQISGQKEKKGDKRCKYFFSNNDSPLINLIKISTINIADKKDSVEIFKRSPPILELNKAISSLKIYQV